MAWVITQKCIKEALAYDVRITPRSRLRDQMERVEEAVRSVIEEIWGERLRQDQWDRIQLPGPLGGSGMRLPATSADAALVATHAATREMVLTVSRAQGWELEKVAGDDDFQVAKANLERSGVRVGGAAEEDRVEMMQQWRSVYESGPWKFDTPVEHLTKYTPSSGSKEGMRGGIKLHARIVRTIEAMQATRVWSEAEGNQH